jgi:hypothetical protein
MAEYRLTATNQSVIRTADNAAIPNDLANTDWVEYQNWLAAGGVPDPYVPPEPEPTPPPPRDAVVVQMMYRAVIVDGAVPAAGYMAWDTTVTRQADANMLKMAAMDGDGIDQGNFWRAPGLINRYLTVQLRSDAAQIMRYTVSGVVDRGSWFEIAVTPTSSSGKPFLQEDSLYVVIGSPGTVAAPPPTTSYVTQAQFSELKAQLDKIAASILGR